MTVSDYVKWDCFKNSHGYFLEAFIQKQIYELEKALKEWDESGKPPHNLRGTLESQLRTLRSFALRDRRDPQDIESKWVC